MRYTHGRFKRVGLMSRSRQPFNVVGNALDCKSKWSRQWSVVFGLTRAGPRGFHGNGHVVRLIDTRVSYNVVIGPEQNRCGDSHSDRQAGRFVRHCGIFCNNWDLGA